MDLVGDVDAERYRIALAAALADPGVDMVALIVLLQTPALTPDVVEVIAEECEKRSKPVIVISAGGRYTEVLKKSMEDMAIRAKELLENLEKSRELAEGISKVSEPPQPDPEEKEIMREMERRATIELEKAEIDKAELEKAEKKEKKKEPKQKEKPKPEKPEIEYE